MAQEICLSQDLQDRGPGIRFSVHMNHEALPAFVIRYLGEVRGYLNRCRHQSTTLDLDNGQFFDTAGQALICATHDAHYDPGNGSCIGGPCDGRGLISVEVYEQDGRVYVDQN